MPLLRSVGKNGPRLHELTERLVRIERGPFIRERQRALVLDMAMIGAQQARQNAHEAGLADPVGTGKVERLSAGQFEAHALEQEPVAAPAGKIIGSETARLHRRTR